MDPTWLQSTAQPEQPLQRTEVAPTTEPITVLNNVTVPPDIEMPPTTTPAASCATSLPLEHDREDSDHDEE